MRSTALEEGAMVVKSTLSRSEDRISLAEFIAIFILLWFADSDIHIYSLNDIKFKCI